MNATGETTVHGVPLIDPDSGLPLRSDRPWSLTDGRTRWPVVEGIPYLRTGREHLRESALAALDHSDGRSALLLLLADRDDFATGDPPSPASLEAVATGDLNLREAMKGLGYGPVADYFAYRWSAPTYLSGLALLESHATEDSLIIEIACGIGHYLREIDRRGRDAIGADVVFSKLWLARRYLVPDVPLVCCDVASLPFGVSPRPVLAFCHDAFYFFPDKRRVKGELCRIIGDIGRVAIGHAHNRDFDHRGVAGSPLNPSEYLALFPDASLYGDADLARSSWTGEPATPRSTTELSGVEAIAIVWSASGDPAGSTRASNWTRPPDSKLVLNPLLVDEAGWLKPRWPSARFEAEYAGESGYLLGERTPKLELPIVDEVPGVSREEVDRLSRRRILLDLPEAW